jgi:hypothetical protein
MTDVSSEMSLDQNTFLKDWPHENGNIKVRKITGVDGREKLQLRVDLGVLQMEMSGRPGRRRKARLMSLRPNNAPNSSRRESNIIIVI